MDSNTKAVAFRVEWDDGTVWTAEGETAAKVMEWYQGGEAMNCIHGTQYSGPQVTVTKGTDSATVGQKEGFR